MPSSQYNLNHRHSQRSGEAGADHKARERTLGDAESPRRTGKDRGAGGTTGSRLWKWLIVGLVGVLVLVAGYFWTSETVVEVSANEGTWRLVESRWVETDGAVFLVGGLNRVVESYPMPGGPPNWIVVGDDYVYAGRVGDGAWPDSGLVRIDRDTLDATVVALPAWIDSPGTEWPEEWLVASRDEVEIYFRVVGVTEDVDGVEAASSIGPRIVDLDGLDDLIEQVGG